MNLGVVFFAAGTATGHDDVVELAKRANSFPENGAMFFPFRNIWDISSLISESQMCIGTSLHGRIVAMSAGIPRINLAVNFTKIKSYCRLWEHSAVPFELTAEQLGDHFENLIEMDRGMLKAHSLWLQESYLTSFEKMCQATGLKQADLVALSDGNHGEALKNSQSLMSEWASDPKTLKTLKRISRRRKKRREGGSGDEVKTVFKKRIYSAFSPPALIDKIASIICWVSSILCCGCGGIGTSPHAPIPPERIF